MYESYDGIKKDLTQIRTGLRQSFIRSKYKNNFLRLNRVEIPQYKKNGELSKKVLVKYECKDCNDLFSQDMINVDHIEMVGTLQSLDDVPDFFKRIFCSYDNLQILCKDCHSVKTKRERKYLAELRKLNKDDIL